MNGLKRLTYIRHAESLSNAGGITLPHAEIPLSETGQRQAAALADVFPVIPAHVLVSPMIRTHQTATPYCSKHGLTPEVNPSLAEFSVIGHALIKGMNGSERKEAVKPYWEAPCPDRRMGNDADTFREFDARVAEFEAGMAALPHGTVIFGHGIWFGLLLWRLLGYSVIDSNSLRAFRRFQLGLPMPNCAIYYLTQIGSNQWAVRADEAMMQEQRKITAPAFEKAYLS
jgi:alpha-ribazole phosphatase